MLRMHLFFVYPVPTLHLACFSCSGSPLTAVVCGVVGRGLSPVGDHHECSLAKEGCVPGLTAWAIFVCLVNDE